MPLETCQFVLGQVHGFDQDLQAAADDADDREEDVVSFLGFLSKSLTENLSVSAQYSYVDNRSNRKAYDYDRHIVGGYLNFRFD